jgi:hypothetical protein
MPLQDFLSSTVEIRIFDFLAVNRKYAYNQSEINKLTGVSRSQIHEKLPAMINNHLVVIDGVAGKYKTYRLADNELVRHLISAIFEHNIAELEPASSKVENDKEEAQMESPATPIENRYYVSPYIEQSSKCHIGSSYPTSRIMLSRARHRCATKHRAAWPDGQASTRVKK